MIDDNTHGHTVGEDDPTKDLAPYFGKGEPLNLAHVFSRGGHHYLAATDGVRVAAVQAIRAERYIPRSHRNDLGPLLAVALSARPERIGALHIGKLNAARAVLGEEHHTILHMYKDGDHKLEVWVEPLGERAYKVERKLALKAIYVHADISVSLKHLFKALGFVGGSADLYLGEHVAEDGPGGKHHRALVLVPFGSDIDAPERITMLMPVV